MGGLRTKHLLGLADISVKDIQQFIDTGFTFREVLERPIKKVPSLIGKNIVNLFFDIPSFLRRSTQNSISLI